VEYSQFQRAGTSVDLIVHGRPPTDLSPVVSHAAHRILQEGLSNAATHAPGQPVTVQVTWESDALLLRMVNPTSTRSAAGATAVRPRSAGHGLEALAEQVELVSGVIEHTGASA
jgi:signal transduction histidine kinase